MCDRDIGIGSGGDKATMCKKGSCLCSEVTTSEPTGEDWILSTGDKVYWYVGIKEDIKNSKLEKKFYASSGKMVETSKEISQGVYIQEFDRKYQNSKYQAHKDCGPTVEGEYKLNIADEDDNAPISGTGERAVLTRHLGECIEIIPAKPQHLRERWGENRVRLRKVEDRSGIEHDRDLNSFYFHDSKKSFTSGCVEVERSFFDELRHYRAKMKEAGAKDITIAVIVKYPNQNHNTGWPL